MDGDLNIKYYQSQISQTKCGNFRGKTFFAKPILMSALFDMIIDERIQENKIYINDCLIDYYVTCFERYLPKERPTPIHRPFYYLKNDGYWHLDYSQTPDGVPTLKFLREHSVASFDTAFWELLQKAEMLVSFKRLVIQKFLTAEN